MCLLRGERFVDVVDTNTRWNTSLRVPQQTLAVVLGPLLLLQGVRVGRRRRQGHCGRDSV